jgi:hypothetical protein
VSVCVSIIVHTCAVWSSHKKCVQFAQALAKVMNTEFLWIFTEEFLDCIIVNEQYVTTYHTILFNANLIVYLIFVMTQWFKFKNFKLLNDVIKVNKLKLIFILHCYLFLTFIWMTVGIACNWPLSAKRFWNKGSHQKWLKQSANGSCTEKKECLNHILSCNESNTFAFPTIVYLLALLKK